MTERDMQFLLWNYPESLLAEPLRKLSREAKAGHGLADMVFEDKDNRILIVEIKRGVLPRSAIGQILEYKGAIKGHYGEKQMRLLVVAFAVPHQLRVVCEDVGIEFREIPEDTFQNLARSVGHRLSNKASFQSRMDRPNRLGRRNQLVKSEKAPRSRGFGRHSLVDCPVLPDTAWRGESRLYREALMESTEAPDNFHLALFLTAVGAGLGKYVYAEVPKRIYPNLYCVLVGQSVSTCKTTAIELVHEFLGSFAPGLRWCDGDVGSAEWFISWLQEQLQEAKGPEIPSLMMRPDEVHSLIEGRHNAGPRFLRLVRDLHSSVPKIEINRVHFPIRIENPPCASLVGETCRLDDLINLPRRLHIDDGIADRMIFVCGDPKGPIPDPKEPDSDPWNRLIFSMQQTYQFWSGKGTTEIRLNDEAQNHWIAFNTRVRDEAGEDPFRVFVTRQFREHVLKVAMIWAALDRSGTINPGHMQAAVSFGEFLLESTLRIFFRDAAPRMRQ